MHSTVHQSFAYPLPKGTPRSSGVTGLAQVLQAYPIYFGRKFENAGHQGLWITVECDPWIIKGGLGQVSRTIPWALHRYLHKNMAILMPLYGPMKEYFQPTHVKRFLDGSGMGAAQEEVFSLWKAQTPEGIPVYAIANDRYFGQLETPYPEKGRQYPNLGYDAMFKLSMMFCRAAAAFMPELMDQKDQGFIIANDWQTAPVFNELNQDFSAKKLLWLHNNYNAWRPDLHGRINWQESNPALQKHTLSTGNPNLPIWMWDGTRLSLGLKRDEMFCKTNHWYSPLRAGLLKANAVLTNQNWLLDYAESVLNTPGKKDTTDMTLIRKYKAGEVYPMLHGLPEDRFPKSNQELTKSGFYDLDMIQAQSSENLSEQQLISAFKAKNKEILQKKLNLVQNPNAIVLAYTARMDTGIKGFGFLLNTIEGLFKQYPNLQLVLAGNDCTSNPATQTWLKKIKNEFPNRVYVSDGFVSNNTVRGIHAGSDLLLAPSTMEPVGCVTLEAMAMGCVPIAFAIGGQRSVLNDPAQQTELKTQIDPILSWNRKNARLRPEETIWGSGQQTGFVLPLHARHGYTFEEGRTGKGSPEEAFTKTVEKALAMAQENPEAFKRIRKNGMQLMREAYTWEKIVKLYEAPLTQGQQTLAFA